MNKYQKQASILARKNKSYGLSLSYREIRNSYLAGFKRYKWNIKRILKFKDSVMRGRL